MMLSNLMTAKSLDENPASHARANTVKTIRLLAPEGFNNLEELDIAWAGGPTVLAAMTLYRHWDELPRPFRVNNFQPMRERVTHCQPMA